MKTKLTASLRGLLARTRAHLGKWRKRLGAVRTMRVDGFEVVVFVMLIAAGSFFCTDWFVGPVADFWRAVLPRAAWQVVIGATGLLVLVGFLEEDFWARRAAALAAACLFWCVGSYTFWHYPHYPFGPLLVTFSITPFWLFTQIAVRVIEHEYRADERAAAEGEGAVAAALVAGRLAGQKG